MSTLIGKTDRPQNILVCDDEWGVLHVIQITLQVRGHCVVTAMSTSQAIEKFEAYRAGGHEWDLIITDVYMPGDSGFFLAGHVRAKGYAGRLAVLTASEADIPALARVSAEYWEKGDAMGKLIDLVEGGVNA